jgi:quinol monooxygenase YgiN
MKTITAWITCRPGTREEFLAAMRPGADATLEEEGCEFFEYHRIADNPDGVVLIEGFRDAAAHELHRRTPHMFDMQAELRRFVAQAALIEVISDDVVRYDLDFVASPPAPYNP